MAPRRSTSLPPSSVTSTPPSSEREGDPSLGGGVSVPPPPAGAAPAPAADNAPVFSPAVPVVPQLAPAPAAPATLDDPQVRDLFSSLCALVQEVRHALPSLAPSTSHKDRHRRHRRRHHSLVVPRAEHDDSPSYSPTPSSHSYSSSPSSSSYHDTSRHPRSRRSKDKRRGPSRTPDVYLKTLARTQGIDYPTSRPRSSAVSQLDRSRELATAYQSHIHKYTGTPSTLLVQQQSLALLEMEELIIAGANLQVVEGRFTDTDAYVLAKTLRTIDYVRESMASSYEFPGRGLNTILSAGPQANAKIRDFGPLRFVGMDCVSGPCL